MKNGVAIRLIGGLGNQMFQYATARSISLRTGALVTMDMSWFGTDPDRLYALAPFAIQASLLDKSKNRENGLLTRISRRLGFPRKMYGLPVFSEASFQYDARIQAVKPPVFLEGYFQSQKYFESIRSQLASEFVVRNAPSPSAANILEQINQSDAICLHIRRGDYVNNPKANAYHGTCSLDYYHAGLAQLAPTFSRPHCFVFSDDPQWVRENFKPAISMTLVDIHRSDEAHEDLRLMAACHSFVIANSSLSWWGAWLGSKAGKRVIAPRQWFRQENIDTSDLIPAEWERL